MVRYSNSIIVPFARERVWRVMADWRNLSAWDTNITRSELSPEEKPDAMGKGTKYDCAFKAGPTELSVDYTCIQFDPPFYCEYEGYAKLFKSNDSIRLEDVPGLENSTKLTATFNLEFRGPLNPVSFTLDGSMQKTGPKVMDEISKVVHEKLGN